MSSSTQTLPTTIALAGATTGFGATVLTQLLYHNPSCHPIVLLTRTPQPHFSSLGASVRVVDYASFSSLVTALQGVHTVLSLIGGSGSALRDAQLALVAAAREAGVKRFVPSEYAGTGGGYDLDLYRGKGEVWDAVKNSGMEYTRFACGLFMNVLATCTPKSVTPIGTSEGWASGEEEALAGLRPWNFVVNVRAGTADLVGDGGGERVVMTEMRDVAKFVVRALELEVWPEELGMRGDFVTWREVVTILERVQGRKFLVREREVEEVKEEAEKGDPGKRFYNQTRVAFAEGWGIVGDDLNRAFPDTKPVSVDEFVEKWWRGVEVGEARWEEDRSFM